MCSLTNGNFMKTTQLLLASLIAFAAATSGCVTKSRRSSALKLKEKSAAPLTMNEVTEEQPIAKTKKRRKATAGADHVSVQPVPTPAPTISQANLQNCERAVAQLVAPVKSLYALLPAGTYAPSDGPLDAVLKVTPADCADRERRGPALQAMATAMNQQTGRIGVILPLSGPRAKLAAFLVKGMRASFQEAGLNFDQVTILKDSAGDARTAEVRLAELVFKDKPALVIGGLEAAEADVLSRRAGELMMPTVLLSRDRTFAARSPYVFSVYPDDKRLADTLVQAGGQRGFKRYAILRPIGGKSDKVSQYFRDAVLASGGRIVQDLVYTPNNFDSMQGVARQLFKTESADRIDEYRAAYRKARQRAQEERVPFDPRMVVLRPIIEFDAVFLPDDFRTARHFAKLFKFHMVDRLPMIGNHEWRSPALVDPFDEFLDGSFFADFIGSYTKLPQTVSAPTIGSPYFVHPNSVAQVDFQLIGYRVGRTARQLLQGQSQTAPIRRRQIPEALAALTSNDATFFGNGRVFDKYRQSGWPTYLFNVTKGGLVLDQANASAAVSSTPAVARPALVTRR